MALVALKHDGRTIGHCLLAMIRVPCEPSRRTVPLSRKRPDLVKMLEAFWALGSLRPGSRMDSRMLLGGNAGEILDRVIERVSVGMVDVTPVGDRTVRRLPNLLM